MTRKRVGPSCGPGAIVALLAIVLAGCGSAAGASSTSAAHDRGAGAGTEVAVPTPSSTPGSSTVALPSEARPIDPDIAISAVTPTDPTRISSADWAAIEALGDSGAQTPHTAHSHGHGAEGGHIELPIFNGDAVTFADQWLIAQRATVDFDSIAKAAALGYVRTSTPGPGVGTHWVLWPQVAKPFDPAHPSMLLFDERKRPAVLVGYAYLVQSDTQPAGFAGDADDWHQHTGLCVVNGWVDREEAVPGRCAGVYLAGGDLWMLHAWVVPAYPNREGRFENYNPTLCPPVASARDFERCPE